MRIDLRFPHSQSLKEKRSLLRPVVAGIRTRFELSVAETAHQNTWQRCELGVAIVGEHVSVVEEVAEQVERFIWAGSGLEVLEIEHRWIDNAW